MEAMIISRLIRNPSLEDVPAEIAATTVPPDARQLRAWIQRYPEFKSEIIDFATAWIEIESAEAAYTPEQEDADLVVSGAMNRVRELLDGAERTAPIDDLAAAIQETDRGIDSFQHTVGIDRSILTCLKKRLIRPTTIPARMIAAIVQALRRDVKAVRAYLCRPPQPTSACKAYKRPELKQIDFAFVVKHANLPEDEKARWLAAPPDPAFRE